MFKNGALALLAALIMEHGKRTPDGSYVIQISDLALCNLPGGGSINQHKNITMRTTDIVFVPPPTIIDSSARMIDDETPLFIENLTNQEGSAI